MIAHRIKKARECGCVQTIAVKKTCMQLHVGDVAWMSSDMDFRFSMCHVMVPISEVERGEIKR